ncbi:Alpha/Beta hydrolase protein [Podospora aff. communis PSN243]|uniref:Alpha/Beta hydrolase protein n=1 Tax=Podospora aff. communis PSN243 TaxID=3040156 RepID=A0AAV9GA41_9PEZI|nr:Alpha/Beta hydrolase protein [Podospora aff. communis PSN243]
MSRLQSPSSAKDLSLLDWVSFAVAIPIFLLRWLTSLTFQNHGLLHWRQKLALTFLRAQRASFPTRILRWSVRRIPTHTAITTYCAKHHIPLQSITLPPSTTSHHPSHTIPPPTLHILTPPSSSSPNNNNSSNTNSPTLFYLHGGGYVNPLRANAHIPFLLACAAATNPPCSRAIIVEYSLAPEHPYPAQLVQSLAALQYTLTDLSIPAESIILAGDSAGAQLIGAVFAHVVKPCPYFPRLRLDVEKGGRFRAAVMVSPFVRLLPPPAGEDGRGEDGRGGDGKDGKRGSYIMNEKRDYLTWGQVMGFRQDWAGEEGEVWANLCGVEARGEGVWDGVFEGQGRVVERVLVTVGTAEVFLDDVRVFAGECVGAEVVSVKRGGGVEGVKGKRRLLVECKDEAHVQVALDMAVGYREGSMMRAVVEWLAGV